MKQVIYMSQSLCDFIQRSSRKKEQLVNFGSESMRITIRCLHTRVHLGEFPQNVHAQIYFIWGFEPTTTGSITSFPGLFRSMMVFASFSSMIVLHRAEMCDRLKSVGNI